MATANHRHPLLSLPSELLKEIATYLPALTLVDLSATCRTLRVHATDDTIWQTLVQQNLPAIKRLTSPYPRSSFRELYGAHHPNWFITKNKIWFADSGSLGKLLVARYNSSSEVIEAYNVTARAEDSTINDWSSNPAITIRAFSPQVQLDLNSTMFRLGPYAHANASQRGSSESPLFSRLQREVTISIHEVSNDQKLFHTFSLARPLDLTLASLGTFVWPPRIMPALERSRVNSMQVFQGNDLQPARLSEMSTGTFRIREWKEFAHLKFSQGGSPRIAETIRTYGTLKECAYTPTPSKPWQGIWVGDYSEHGCEFLLVTQPDEAEALQLPRDATQSADYQNYGLVYSDTYPHLNISPFFIVTPNPFTASGSADTRVESSSATHTGRIEAIKLTGDIYVPPGEYSFIVPDIGPGGLIGIADEDPFKGSRVMRSVAQIAGEDFHGNRFVSTQLIMISHDRLAHYWEPFGHISYYQRIDIDALIRGD
ncbi:MAG: hypothetical protein M1820_003600 [Bogoriella megaspora]|nr:MAG: hypothetical protein M1820_003600 [Bogoriella megaspora]